MNKSKLLTYSSVFLLSIASISISGCTPTHSVRGNYLKDYQITEVVAGTDTEYDVVKKLGSPTAKSTFDDKIWYYIGQETEKRGIFDATVTDEQVVVVTFDEKKTVQTIEIADADRIDLPYTKDSTPTSGNEITVMQQLVGNIGKFNNNAPDPAGP